MADVEAAIEVTEQILPCGEGGAPVEVAQKDLDSGGPGLEGFLGFANAGKPILAAFGGVIGIHEQLQDGAGVVGGIHGHEKAGKIRMGEVPQRLEGIAPCREEGGGAAGLLFGHLLDFVERSHRRELVQ